MSTTQLNTDANSFTSIVAQRDRAAIDEAAQRRLDAQPALPGSKDASLAAVEIAIRWGDNVLAVEQLSPPRAYHVGSVAGCDYDLPRELLGADRVALVDVDGDTVQVVLPKSARVSKIAGDEAAVLISSAAASASRQLSLAPGERYRISLGQVSFDVRGVEPEKKQRGRLRLNKRGIAATAFSAAAQIGLLMATAAFMPALEMGDDTTITEDQRYLMQHYLDASAEAEAEATNADSAAAGTEDGDPNETEQAEGEPGTVGDKRATRYPYNSGPGNGPTLDGAPQTREQALAYARDFGMIDLLRMSELGNVPLPWDVPLADAPGSGIFDPNGSWGADPFAIAGELGLSNPGGEGSNTRGDWYGTRIGDVFRNGSCQGPSCGGLRGTKLTRTAGGPNLRLRSNPITEGSKLPPGAVQRVVHSNFGRFRGCYQAGLQRNPSLAGRVAVAFVISRDGRVVSANDAGSDLPDGAVVSCVVNAFHSLTFTAPENGIVRVTYPLMFIPSQS